VPPFAEFNTDTNTDSTDNLHEHSSGPLESEPRQDTDAISQHEARPTMPSVHVAATRVDSDNSSMRSPNADSIEPVAAQNPFSYGYGYGHGRASSASSSTPIPFQLSPSTHLLSSTSGLAKVMASKRIAPSSPAPSRPASRKRFSAPLPFTRLVGGGSGAGPVVDLGTAGRERGLGGGWDSSLDVGVTPGGEGRVDVIWATWDYVRDRWVFFHLRSS
jgi:hypothetical protein